jgi:pyruvate formate lyase activating enzyme
VGHAGTRSLILRVESDTTATPLRIGGLTPLSATDFPGELAAVVYCQGCPWRCSYCHNPHLLPGDSDAGIAWSEVLEFLRRRFGLLDAVVFSGGEPTAQKGLAAAMREVKALGYRVGLHSAGIYPRRFAQVLPLADWVGFDAKAPFDASYARITGVTASGEAALESAKLLLASGVDCEFRTTWDADFLTPAELDRLAASLKELGVRSYVLQQYRAPGRISSRAEGRAPAADLDGLARRFARFSLRPA